MALIATPGRPDKEKEYEKLKNRMKNMNTVRYSLNIPSQLHEKIRLKAVRKRMKLNQIILQLLDNYLKEDN